ncbi:porin, partial [Leptospira sp. SA-E8]|uniref:porin n=1 Tax=Leptospira sp. SA-E8 TaxID=3422259 RepID=UPI003EBEBA31
MTAAAGAMADVTITGVFDTTLRLSSYDAGKATAPAKAETKTTQIGRDGSGTSGLYFSATEDLGDGLKALGFYELDVNPWDSTSTFNGGQKFAGLSGSFGSIKLGSVDTPSLTAQGVRAGLFGTKDGGRGVAGGQTATNNGGAASFLPTTTLFGTALTRFSSSVRYDTPSFSGFSAAVNYVPESDTGTLSASQ